MRTLLVLAILLLPQPVLAWSPEGHQVVAAIAARELTPKARTQVASLLGGEAMLVLDSSWADEVRQQRPDTATWHYVNIELGSRGYDAARDCPGGNCVVTQIERDQRILVDPRSAREAKAEALRFLIHFVADVHQPLHVSDRGDQGGNLVLARWHGKRISLHQIWDNEVVAVQGRDPARIAAQIDSGFSSAQKVQMAAGSAAAWANESFAVAEREIYSGLPNSNRINLPDDYARKKSGVARLQLARAGIRLAAILNRVFN